MSEPSTSIFKTHFSINRLISDLTQLFTLILSHPLYLSYLIFFSPYLFKLISVLYPLFLTTFLISLASLLFLVHDLDGGGGGDGYRLITYASLTERWRRIGRQNQENTTDQEEGCHDHQCSESLQIYEILFGSSSSSSSSLLGGDEERKSEGDETAENHRPDHQFPESTLEVCVVEEKLDSSVLVCAQELENIGCNRGELVEEKRMEKFLRILDEFEKMSARTEKSTTTGPGPAKNGSQAKGNIKKVNVAIHAENACTPLVKSRSQRPSSNAGDNTGDYQSTHGSSGDMDYDLGTYGSMRKEKEWKRTLACKLFEERHNVDGGEGMDSLWEAYEMDSNKSKSRNSEEKTKKKYVNKNKNKNKIVEKELYDDDEEELDEEIGSGQLCCLQAFKLSAGKMSMGMGRPNLVKISKAIKGFGWLHSVSSSKHSKKVHNSTGDHHKDRY